jgi:hypothetical protein
VLIRTRPTFVVALLVAALAGVACGGPHSYKAGTPAATGQAPDCSVIPLDVVKDTLGKELSGPSQSIHGDTTTCSYSRPRSGIAAVDQVLLYSHVDPQSFAIIRDGFKRNNNVVKKIKGWGDEAYASTVHFFADNNTFAVRKGKVSVLITSTADYDHIKKLMKTVLAKL